MSLQGGTSGWARSLTRPRYQHYCGPNHLISHHTSQARAQKDINKRTSQEPSEFPDHSLARSNLPNSKITTRPGHASCTLPSPLPHCLPLMLTHTIRPHAPHVPPPLHLSLSLFSSLSCKNKFQFHPRPIQIERNTQSKTKQISQPRQHKKVKKKKKRGKKSSALRCFIKTRLILPRKPRVENKRSDTHTIQPQTKEDARVVCPPPPLCRGSNEDRV